MVNLEYERARLAEVERDIVEGEIRIVERLIELRRLTGAGQDTTRVARALRALEHDVQERRAHRQGILTTIARLERAV
jgi:hypothetical protein